MDKLLPVVLLIGCTTPEIGARSQALTVGDRCGECAAGSWDGADCVYPSEAIDPVQGLPPGDTGGRPVFHTEAYTGSDLQKVRKATLAAAPVGGAVVLDRVYEVSSSVLVEDGVLYTGGGLRRACGPHAVTTAAVASGVACIPVDTVAGFVASGTHLANTSPAYAGTLGQFGITIDVAGKRLCRKSNLSFAIPAGSHITKVYDLVQLPTSSTGRIVFDSVLFDGAADCNPWVHDWRYNMTMAMRGPNTVRRSVFYDTPSENVTICGGNMTDNVALDLGGSFVHKSCSISPVDQTAIDVVSGNYVENVNLNTDQVMQHSEGLVTFSANSRMIFLSHNVFRFGLEGVLGTAQPEDENLAAVGDCYAHFPRLGTLGAGTNAAKLRFVDTTFIDTPSSMQP